MLHTPPEKNIKIEQKIQYTLNFKDILLPKRKTKKSSLLSISKTITKKIRQTKNDKLRIIRQMPLHPRDRLVRKVKI